jgi:hypothetical protein
MGRGEALSFDMGRGEALSFDMGRGAGVSDFTMATLIP